MKIAIVGAGDVGKTLGTGWSKGHRVDYVGRTLPAAEKGALVGAAEVVVVATPAHAVDAALDGLPLAGKIVVDCTNPLKPDLSGLTLGTDTSAAEHLAAIAPGARVVKAFNTVGFNIMANPSFGDHSAVMFVAGDDAEAKKTVLALASELGFEGIDAGELTVARYLEPFAMLWIHLAYRAGLGRDFAFSVLRR